MLKAAWQGLMELLYPHRCPICNQIVEDRPQLCADCVNVFDIRFVNARIIEDGHIDVLIFLTHYKQIRHALYAAKFENNPQALTILAEAFAQVWQTEHEQMLQNVYAVNLSACRCVIVPTDYKRRLRRGYDIPELLFRNWLDCNNLDYKNILRRVRSTSPQFELSRAERRSNVLNSIEVIDEVRGKDIILLDDIFTTGASMNEAARALKLKGAGSIVALAFASDLE